MKRLDSVNVFVHILIPLKKKKKICCRLLKNSHMQYGSHILRILPHWFVSRDVILTKIKGR